MRWDEVTVSGYLQNRSIGLHPYDTHRTNIFRLQSGQVTKGDQVRHTMPCPPTCDGFCLVPSSCCCGGCEWLSEHLTFPSDPDQKRLCQASCTALVHRSDTKASKPLHLDNNLCRRALLRYLKSRRQLFDALRCSYRGFENEYEQPEVRKLPDMHPGGTSHTKTPKIATGCPVHA